MLRELTGPGLVSPLSGWWLELDFGTAGPGLSIAESWQAFRKIFPAQVEQLIPGLSCPVPDHPVDCCVSLARRLADPIRLRCLLMPSPAAPHLPARRALIRSAHHELAGEALALGLAILQEILRPGPSHAGQVESLRQAAFSIQQRAGSVTSHAFTNAVINQASQRGLQMVMLHERLDFYPLLQIGTGSRSRILN